MFLVVCRDISFYIWLNTTLCETLQINSSDVILNFRAFIMNLNYDRKISYLN